MTITSTDGDSYIATDENQLKDIMKMFGFKLIKINPDSKRMQRLKRELRFEKKNISNSLMKNLTKATIKKLEKDIKDEQKNCKKFKKI